MTRMSREFSLVLLGSGILTAGYFVAPEEDLNDRADRQAVQQVAGEQGTRHRHHYGYGHLVFLHMPMGGGRGAPAGIRPNVTRGGFGGLGHSMSGIS
jgi:hypothetical protein